MISQKLLNELKVILEKEYGQNLNEKQIFETANNLVNFFEILAKIEHREKFKNKN